MGQCGHIQRSFANLLTRCGDIFNDKLLHFSAVLLVARTMKRKTLKLKFPCRVNGFDETLNLNVPSQFSPYLHGFVIFMFRDSVEPSLQPNPTRQTSGVLIWGHLGMRWEPWLLWSYPCLCYPLLIETNTVPKTTFCMYFGHIQSSNMLFSMEGKPLLRPGRIHPQDF